MLKTSLIGIAFLGLGIASCGGDKKEKVEDTTAKVQVQKIGELKIAYYDQDSMKENFDYFKEQESILKKKEIKFNKAIEQKQKEFQSSYNNFVSQQSSQVLSENEIKAYEQNLQIQQNNVMQFQQNEGAKLEAEAIKKMDEITKKVDAYSKKYCEENGIDILLIHAKGGQFNYINPSMNVTKEFTAYLNQNQEAIQEAISKKIK